MFMFHVHVQSKIHLPVLALGSSIHVCSCRFGLAWSMQAFGQFTLATFPHLQLPAWFVSLQYGSSQRQLVESNVIWNQAVDNKGFRAATQAGGCSQKGSSAPSCGTWLLGCFDVLTFCDWFVDLKQFRICNCCRSPLRNTKLLTQALPSRLQEFSRCQEARCLGNTCPSGISHKAPSRTNLSWGMPFTLQECKVTNWHPITSSPVHEHFLFCSAHLLASTSLTQN